MKNIINSVKEVRSLVYVPNTFCNLGCRYCYLGKSTDVKNETENIVEDLVAMVDKFTDNNILIDRVILHGAEFTAMGPSDMEKVLRVITEYKKIFKSELQALGSGKDFIHIKTNLYNFDKVYKILEEFNVSVSGSFDLPLETHDKYRVTKNNKPTSKKIIENITLLQQYKGNKHLSCVVTKEVYGKKEQFVKDIENLAKLTGHDMVDKFYIMFSYDSVAASEKFNGAETNASMLTPEEQVKFYNFLKYHFRDTVYEKGIKYNWFKEFLPEYCTFKHNCGVDGMLIQKNGDVYPCHRAQPRQDFYFGNVFKDKLPDIKYNAVKTIQERENETELPLECIACKFFTYCRTGCTLVKKETKIGKSYTCSLQKELYKDNPDRFPPLDNIERDRDVYEFMANNNRRAYMENYELAPYFENQEINEKRNYLNTIISGDEILNEGLRLDNVLCSLNGVMSETISAKIPYMIPEVLEVSMNDEFILYIRKDIMGVNCLERDIKNNNLILMFLGDNIVSYGDEGRLKQEHIINIELYHGNLEDMIEGEYYKIDLNKIISRNRDIIVKGKKIGLYITTKEIKKYHYRKHAENAFYHIQAINLPFNRLYLKLR